MLCRRRRHFDAATLFHIYNDDAATDAFDFFHCRRHFCCRAMPLLMPPDVADAAA